MRGLQAVALVDMMLECLQRPEQSVADSAMQYLTCLDFVPMAERARCSALSPLGPGMSTAACARACVPACVQIVPQKFGRPPPTEAVIGGGLRRNHPVASLIHADPQPVLDRNLTG